MKIILHNAKCLIVTLTNLTTYNCALQRALHNEQRLVFSTQSEFEASLASLINRQCIAIWICNKFRKSKYCISATVDYLYEISN